MSFKIQMKGLGLAPDTSWEHDFEAISPCQEECIQRLAMFLQSHQEAYLMNHPEVTAMLEHYISKMVQSSKRKDVLNDTVRHFVRPVEELDDEIRKILNISPSEPYIRDDKQTFYYRDSELEADLISALKKHYGEEVLVVPSREITPPDTLSSSFISLRTSGSTLPTPEPIATPELTLSETFYNVISNTVDKAIFSKVTDEIIRFDTAYVELMKAVEIAMEIPVIPIRHDIANLITTAYMMFEFHLEEQERIAAEIAWEKRMRKKLKRTLRRQRNFRGYETPPTPKSQISSHPSYLMPMPPPCKCQPQVTYNRYPKDRFGIYLPRDVKFSNETVTQFTSAASLERLERVGDNGGAEATSGNETVRSGATTDTDSTHRIAHAGCKTVAG